MADNVQARSQGGGGLGVKPPQNGFKKKIYVAPYVKIYLNSSVITAKILNQIVFPFHR